MTSIFPDGELDDAVELGAIDDRSVRVWVRVSKHPAVNVTLASPGHEVVSQTVQLSKESDWTGVAVLSLHEAAPESPFVVAVGDQRVEGRFGPAPGAPAALTFGLGSCHMPYTEDENDQLVVRENHAAIYPAIANDLKRANGQLMLLVGDQIYADEIESINIRSKLPRDRNNPPPVDELLARYRYTYRGFFNQSGFRALREAFPTLCTWDDHDIFDNWGSTAEKTPADLQLFAAACRAYAEYQHSRNPDGVESVPPFHWVHRWGNIAILGLDVRGARDYESGTMLGTSQWEWLTSWLAGDDAQQVATLFVISSVPIAHAARWFTKMFDLVPARFAEPVRDRWSATGFIESRDALLETLFSWKAAGSARQVIILSGDVHSASAFSIRQKNGSSAVHQFTSSAMTTQMDLKQIVFNQAVVHGANLFESRYRFERHFLSLTNNYGGVRVEPLPTGGHRIILAIRSWDPEHRRLRTTGRLVLRPDA